MTRDKFQERFCTRCDVINCAKTWTEVNECARLNGFKLEKDKRIPLKCLNCRHLKVCSFKEEYKECVEDIENFVLEVGVDWIDIDAKCQYYEATSIEISTTIDDSVGYYRRGTMWW